MVMVSSDGVLWTPQVTPVQNGWKAVTWSPELGIFLAVASTGVGSQVLISQQAVLSATITSPVDGDTVVLSSKQTRTATWTFVGDDVLLDLQLWHNEDMVWEFLEELLFCWTCFACLFFFFLHSCHGLLDALVFRLLLFWWLVDIFRMHFVSIMLC